MVNDLVEMLTRMGIEPLGKSETGRPQRRFTEHRTSNRLRPQTSRIGGRSVGIDLDVLAAMEGRRHSGGDGNRPWRQSRAAVFR